MRTAILRSFFTSENYWLSFCAWFPWIFITYDLTVISNPFALGSTIDAVLIKVVRQNITFVNHKKWPLMILMALNEETKEIVVAKDSKLNLNKTNFIKKSVTDMEVRIFDPVREKYLMTNDTLTSYLKPVQISEIEYEYNSLFNVGEACRYNFVFIKPFSRVKLDTEFFINLKTMLWKNFKTVRCCIQKIF